MAYYVLRRLVGVAAVLWAAATLTFFVLQVIPGDPVAAAMAEANATEDMLAQRRAALGLDLPLPLQYARYLANLLRGDMGISWYGGEPVAMLLRAYAAPTLSLALSGVLVAIALGVGLGMLSVAGGGGWRGQIARSVTGFVLSTPVMFSGTLLIWAFAIWLDFLPATGQGGMRHLILPALAVGLTSAGGIARALDASVSATLGEPFIQTARAKGLRRWRMLWRHAFRVGALPVVDMVALQFGYLAGGAVVTESVFARSGLGRLLVDAVLRRDLPVVQGVVLVSALAYGLLNVLADILHAWLDPRLRVGAE
jgi:ABC-type dipeptide/oligopeptide/nickel transport system permease component